MPNPAKNSPFLAQLARYTTPLTVLMWAMVVLGAVDVFYPGIVPAQISQWNLVLLWPVVAAAYFAIRYKKKLEAEAAARSTAGQ